MNFKLFFRSLSWEPGPALPVAMSYPCVENTATDLIFIIGRVFNVTANAGGTYNHNLNINPAIEAYLFSPVTSKWINVNDIPCTMNESRRINKYTCTFLKSQNVVITVIENCTAVFNMTLMEWTEFDAPLKNGVVFKNNMEDNIVYYIAKYAMNSSNIYIVSHSNRFNSN